MLRNTRLLVTCAFAAGVFSAGCGPDGQSLTGPSLTGAESQFDQSGLGAGGQPEIHRAVQEVKYVDDQTCLFPIQVEGEARITVQNFETHLVTHIVSTVTLTNLVTGYSIDDNGSFTAVVHLSQSGASNVTLIGSVVRVTIPSQGIVAQGTGVLTFSVKTGIVLFEAGPHEIADYCALLSGGAA